MIARQDGMRTLQVYIVLDALSKKDAHLECVEDCCCCVDLPPELLQDVIHLIHHLLPDSASRLDGFEAVQQLKCSISTSQLPAGEHQQKSLQHQEPACKDDLLETDYLELPT